MRLKQSLFLLLIVLGLSMIPACGGGGGSVGGTSGSGSSIAVTTLAGSPNGTPGFTNGAGNSATFNGPAAITTDGINLYVADMLNNAIRKIVISSGVVSTLAGSLNGSPGFANGASNSATFNGPQGISTDGTSLYVADTLNNAVRKIVIAPVVTVTTLAGSVNGTAGFANGAGNAATFYGPQGITLSPDGTTLYVADTLNNAIRKIVIASGAVSTLAGSLNGTPGFTDGAGNAATFNGPSAISTDGINLYVADTLNNAIRKIVISSGVVSTLAGSPNGTPGFTDGAGNAAAFNNPWGITLSPDGTTLYVSDKWNNAIREIVIATGVVSTLAGSGKAGFANGAGTSAMFYYPRGITTNGTTLYVADFANCAIRKIQLQ